MGYFIAKYLGEIVGRGNPSKANLSDIDFIAGSIFSKNAGRNNGWKHGSRNNSGRTGRGSFEE
jgi:hypothetical protein